MKFFNMRLDLSEHEFNVLKNCIDFEKLNAEINKNPIENKLISKINNPKKIEYSFKKHTASEKATKARTEKVKGKINLAIEMLQEQKMKITPYSISKLCGVSFVTVKKYYNENTLTSLNEIK